MSQSSAMDTLKRVRRIKERLAELDWMEAQAAQRDQQARTEENARQAVASHETMDGQSESMLLHHLHALQLEMTARRDLQQLASRRARTVEKQGRMRQARLETRVVECAEQAMAAENRHEAERPAQAALDEIGISSWWRRGTP